MATGTMATAPDSDTDSVMTSDIRVDIDTYIGRGFSIPDYDNLFRELIEFKDRLHALYCSEFKVEKEGQLPLALTFMKKKGKCRCRDTFLGTVMSMIKTLSEKELVQIFKTHVLIHKKRPGNSKMFDELVKGFHEICFDNAYPELARCTFQINMDPKTLEEHMQKLVDIKSTQDKSTQDKFTAVIVSMMDSQKVQSFFDKKEANENVLDYIIQHKQETLVAILDKMVQQDKDGDGYVVQKKFLEMDDNKKEPSNIGYNFSHQTIFQKIAFRRVEDAVCNRAFFKMIEKKWEHWCKRIFIIDACIYLSSALILTFVVAASANARHVVSYQSPIDYIRAVFEVLLLINAIRLLGIELYQVFRLKKKYFMDLMNIFELSSPLLLILVLPFRYLHEQTHWFIYAAAYMVWLLQIVKYALVFRFTGVYVDSLWKMITRDILKFALILLISITVFSGTFLLVLKAENTLELHEETGSFMDVFLVGIRIMIESDSIVEYTGDEGYNGTGAAVMMIFMFFTIVILLNMLIAQLLNTYQNIDSTSLKGFYVRRAKLVARLERESIPWIWNIGPWDIEGNRKECYKEELKMDCNLTVSPDFKQLSEDTITLQHLGGSVDSVSYLVRNNNDTIKELEKNVSECASSLKQIQETLKRQEEDLKESFENILSYFKAGSFTKSGKERIKREIGTLEDQATAATIQLSLVNAQLTRERKKRCFICKLSE